MAKRVALYTSGESSSVPAETAQELLASLLCTLGLDADDLAIKAIIRLLAEGVDAAFARGMKEMAGKVEAFPALWEKACFSIPLLESRALKDTLNSMKTLTQRYDYRFFAHSLTCDIDYPLCHPVPDSYQGIDYATEYLERILIESELINCFDLKRCKSLLDAVSPEYGELLINLYEPVATNALGCILSQEPLARLCLSDSGREAIAREFAALSPTSAKERLNEAALALCDRLGLRSPASRGYVCALSASLYPRLRSLAAGGGLGLKGVFLQFR